MTCCTDKKCVSIHPYFRAKPGKLAALKEVCKKLVALCETEPECLYFGFTFNGDDMYCREAYNGAAGVFAHLENAGAAIGDVLENADLVKIEVHGPAEDLEQLKEPLKGMNPTYYTLEFGC